MNIPYIIGDPTPIYVNYEKHRRQENRRKNIIAVLTFAFVGFSVFGIIFLVVRHNSVPEAVRRVVYYVKTEFGKYEEKGNIVFSTSEARQGVIKIEDPKGNALRVVKTWWVIPKDGGAVLKESDIKAFRDKVFNDIREMEKVDPLPPVGPPPENKGSTWAYVILGSINTAKELASKNKTMELTLKAYRGELEIKKTTEIAHPQDKVFWFTMERDIFIGPPQDG